MISLQIPEVQTFVAQRTLARILDRFDGKLEFSSLAIQPFNTLILSDLVLMDDEPLHLDGKAVVDTVFKAGELTARFGLNGILSKNGIKINSVEVSNACLVLTSEPDEKYKNNIARIFHLVKKQKEKSTKDVFSIKKARLNDFNFRLVSLKPAKKEYPGYGMDWSDLDINADIVAKNIRFANSIMSGTAERVGLREKSGYLARNISGKAKVGRGRTLITDLHIQDPWSDAFIPEFRMDYAENCKPFKDFMNKVRIHGEIAKGTLAFKTLSFFVPSLKDNDIVADISTATVDGFSSGLKVAGFRFKDRTSGIESDLSVSVSGLHDLDMMTIDADVNEFRFTTKGLSAFINQWTAGKDMDFSSLAGDEVFGFSGKARGPLSDLTVDGKVNSGIGSAGALVSIKGLTGDRKPGLSGKFSTDDLDLGRIIGKDFIHECSMNSVITAGLSDGTASVTIDSLNVSRLNLNGYDYSDIMAAGTFSQQSFNGRIICNDPNLNFMFQGMFNLGRHTHNARYRFYASLGYADLNALNIDSRGRSRVTVGSVDADYTRIARGDLTGSIDANGIILENAAGVHDIGNLRINSRSGENNYEIRLSSSFADGIFTGTDSPGAFVRFLQDITTRKELFAMFGEPEEKWKGDTFRLDFNLHDTRDVLSFLAPGTYLADSTSFRVRVSEDGILRGRLSSQRIAFKEKYLKGLSIEMDNDNNALNCKITGDELRIAQNVLFKDNAIMLYANDNSVGLGYDYDNATETENSGEFYITADLSSSKPGDPVIKARTLASNICLNGDNWKLEPAGCVYSKKGTSIDGFRISNGEQSITVDGGISKTQSDSLFVNLDSFDLSQWNALAQKNLDLAGLASGRLLLISPVSDGFGLEASIDCESARIAGHDAGTVIAGCSMSGDDRLVFSMRNSIGGESSIDTRGTFRASDRMLEVFASLNSFDLGYASPFIASVFNGMEGKLDGSINIHGPLSRLDISSNDLRISDGILQLAFTNVPYSVRGPLHIDNQGLYFDSISLKDRYNGSGTITGGIRFDRFKDIRMDTGVRVENIEVLNTSASDNSSFYGRVFGTGRVNVSGPFNAIALDIEATTAKEGSFHIPLNSSGSTGAKDLLVFIEPERFEYIDPYDLMMNSLQTTKKIQNNLGVKLKVNATPGVEANLEIDRSTGNVLTGRGAGTISLDVRPASGTFNINGDYTLNSGNYHFSALGIANKDFAILDGSSIKFNGDIMDSDLNIDAQYSTKTSLSSLISDTTSVSTRRNVECGLSITDKLRNPQLSFSINVPDLDPATKSRVESALSTDDKVQKQFMALLVTNNFLPDDQSGIVNNSNILYSNVADIMADQLNNILQRLEIPLDLGLKYQESGSGASIFDVALSTQLFNNRVSVNGNIGNRQYRNSGNGDVVGDLDIEVKMDRDGEVRFNLFSHSADAYTNFLDDSQRNGIGVAYQKEFNSIGQFIKGLFTPKSVKQAKELEELTRDEEKVILNIEH